MQDVPRADIPAEIPLEVGLQLQMRAPTGQVMPVTVAAITEETVTLDANHALAGKDLTFAIELVSIGEQTNRLEWVLVEAADSIERRTNRRLDLLVRLLEPVLLLVMAVAILFVLLALLLPVFQSAGSLG